MVESLYCSATHLKLIVGSADANVVKVEDFAMFDLPEDAMINGIITDQDAMAGYLSEIGSDVGLLKREATLVIDNNSMRFKVMDVPKASEPKTLEFVERDLGAFSGDEPSDIFDYAVLDPRLPGGGVRILAAAVDREVLRVYRDAFLSAGFSLKRIDIGVNAVIKLGSISPQLAEGARILAVVDGHSLILLLFEGGEYRITNRYRLFSQDGTPGWEKEISDGLSSMIQSHKGQRPAEEISAAFFAGLPSQRADSLAGALSPLGIETGVFDIGPHARATGKAAQKDPAFPAGDYIFNLGSLLKKRGR